MIKFTYFDVGGVALQDFTGRNRREEFYTKIKIGSFGSLYHLWNLFLKKCSIAAPDLYRKFIFYRLRRLEQNKSIWNIINEIEKKSKIGLLTNMYPKFFEQIKKDNLLPKNKWEVIVDSSVEGYEKPDLNLFKIAEKRSGFHGKEILFIDNTKQNVDAAISFGWNAFLYNPNDCDKSNEELLNFFGML